MADVKFLDVWAPTGRTRKVDGEEKPEPWARIGVAFPMKDGTGFTIKLNSLPLDGTIIVRPPKPKDNAPVEPEGI